MTTTYQNCSDNHTYPIQTQEDERCRVAVKRNGAKCIKFLGNIEKTIRLLVATNWRNAFVISFEVAVVGLFENADSEGCDVEDIDEDVYDDEVAEFAL